MTDFALVANDSRRPCNACGETHPFLSSPVRELMPCDTPMVFTAADAAQLKSFGTAVPLPDPPTPSERGPA